LSRPIIFIALLVGCTSSSTAMPLEFARRGPDCHARGLLPDPTCTPGDVATNHLNIICGSSTRDRRNVPDATKEKVLKAYGMEHGDLEIDHLVAIEIGGSNSMLNLWPEKAPGYGLKDIVENWTHRQICSGKMSVERAQLQMAIDWTVLQKEMEDE
jgi:hypothetical protein